MSNIIIKTNEEINAIAMEYKAAQSEDVFMELYSACLPLAQKVGYKMYHQSKGLGKPAEDFLNVAEYAIFTATKNYEAEKGGSFTAFLKRSIQWAINDEIIKKASTKTEQFHSKALSLDKPLSSGEGTFLDAVEYQVATEADEVFNQVAESLESPQDSYMSIVNDLIAEFSQSASDVDGDIIKHVFSTILSVEDATARVVNKALESAMPDFKSATLRKKKSRALTRFTDFAKEKGFSQLDLSQF